MNNNNQGCALNSSASARSANRNRIAAVLASAVLFGGIVGVGVIGMAAEATAKPKRDTTNNGTCTELRNDRRAAVSFINQLTREKRDLENKMGTPQWNQQAWNELFDTIALQKEGLADLDREARAIGC